MKEPSSHPWLAYCRTLAHRGLTEDLPELHGQIARPLAQIAGIAVTRHGNPMHRLEALNASLTQRPPAHAFLTPRGEI